MPVCILGMHRSGTSMVTNTLKICGLYLGPEEELLDPKSGYLGSTIDDNPKGYWESIPFIEFNEEILQTFCGSYIQVPDLVPGWSNDTKLLSFKHRVVGLTVKHQIQPVWGWKDPRNSLTLEFWQAVFPDLKVVVCIRNPVEVIDSVTGRNFSDRNDAIKWWLAYHQTMLATLSSTSYIVTHYESYFYDPEVEIRRVVDFIGLEGTEDQIKQAALVNDLQLHRHVYPDELLDNASIPASVRQHYLSLRQEAGPVFQKLISDPVYQKQVFKLSLGQAHKLLGDYEKSEVDYQERLNKVLSDHSAELEANSQVYQRELDTLNNKYAELMATHAQMQMELDTLNNKYAELMSTHAQTQRYYQEQILLLNAQPGGETSKHKLSASTTDSTAIEPTFITGRLIRGVYRKTLPLSLRLKIRDIRRLVFAPLRSVYHLSVPLETRLRIRDIRVQLVGR